MRIIDLSYHSSYRDLTPEAYLKKADSNIGYSRFLRDEHELAFVFHTAVSKRISGDGVDYFFRKKRHNSKWIFPLALSFQLRELKPDVVLVHSIIYIHFAALLRLFLPAKTMIFIQNHAEKTPGSRLKRAVIRLCDRAINGYFFTSRELAKPWIERRLLASSDKIYELMEGSTSFQKKDKSSCRSELGIPDVDTFIWVGRLDDNKDPLCVLKALSAYTKAGHRYKMYMFYTSIELLEEIQNFISGNGLEEYIELKGNIVHSELELWYSASDFFIAASHSEGSGYALSEAMSCGCIPILTDIPAFSYMTNKGKAGLLFTPGDAEELLQRLLELRVQDRKILQSYVKEVFENRLSFMAIANRMMEIFELKK